MEYALGHCWMWTGPFYLWVCIRPLSNASLRLCALPSKLRLLVLIRLADKLLIAQTVWTCSVSCPLPPKTSFIFMTTLTISSWFLINILNRVMQICKSLSASVKSRERTMGVKNVPVLLQAQVCTCPRDQIPIMEGQHIPTINSHIHAPHPLPWASWWLWSFLLSLQRTGKREPGRYIHTDSQLT